MGGYWSAEGATDEENILCNNVVEDTTPLHETANSIYGLEVVFSEVRTMGGNSFKVTITTTEEEGVYKWSSHNCKLKDPKNPHLGFVAHELLESYNFTAKGKSKEELLEGIRKKVEEVKAQKKMVDELYSPFSIKM